MKVLIIDNYDSFTYNLSYVLTEITGHKPFVVRNDDFDHSFCDQFDRIVLSPGPGIPAEAGQLIDVIRTYGKTKDILGVCLGHQAIIEALGGRLINLPQVYHGISTPIRHLYNDDLFEGISEVFEVGRYHSWIADRNSLPADLIPTAFDMQGQLMAFKHVTYRLRGIQFHPESILTPNGKKILENWIRSLSKS